MITKLCCLFTFIFSVTNMLGVTNLSWGLVFAPTFAAIALNLIVIIIALIITFL